MADLATVNNSILSMQKSLESFLGTVAKQEAAVKRVIKSTADLTAAQYALGVRVDKDGKLVNEAGAYVNQYGKAITKTGEVMGNFNKRSQILNNTIAYFTKQGKAVSFFEGYSKYLEMGGSRLEFFAEYLSSTREELTIFGLEAAKARKVMYGFLPPGMFRLFNKFSSIFQFVGGTMRKFRDNGKGAQDELKKLTEVLSDPKISKSAEEIDAITERIAALKEEAGGGGNFFASIKTLASGMDKLIQKTLIKPIGEGYKVNNKKNPLSWMNAFRKNTFMAFGKMLASPFVGLKKVGSKATSDVKGVVDSIKQELDLSKKFKEGFNIDKNIKKTEKQLADLDITGLQGKIDAIDVNALTKDLEKLEKGQAKRLETQEKITKKIQETLDVEAGAFIDLEKVNRLQDELDKLNAIGDKQQKIADTLKEKTGLEEEMIATLAKKEKLEKKLFKQQAQNLGTKQLKDDIKASKERIKLATKERDKIAKTIEKKGADLTTKTSLKKTLEAQLPNLSGSQKAWVESQVKNLETEIADLQIDLPKLATDLTIKNEEIKTETETNTEQKESLKVLKDMKKDSLSKIIDKNPKLKMINGVFKKFGGMLNTLKFVLKFAATTMVYVALAIIGIVVLIKAFGPIIKDAFGKAMDVFKAFFPYIEMAWTMISNALGKIFDSIFGGGSIEQLIDGIIELAIGILGMALVLLTAILAATVVFLVEFSKGIWTKFLDYVKSIFTSSKKFVKAILIVISIAAGIAAIIMGAPIWLAALVALAVFKFGKRFIDPVAKAVSFIVKLGKTILNMWIAGINGIIAGINYIKPGKDISKLKKLEGAYAEGGVSSGGMALVGEKGPELIELPAGTRINSNAQSQQMMKSNEITNNFNIKIESKGGLNNDAELRRISDAITKQITQKLNRTYGQQAL